ncbi:DUF1793-domain-containing protein [Mycena venus]|uniref:DUF1793-domain-containing protein n=1 Tax=Mycena venus TaxID=2733690 RepID=A0A8H6Y6S4_9AGAR|nr:DUF1793-domain-containing protein [Mycena venus]
MHLLHVASLLLLAISSTVHALSWTATPFNPSSIPLAVRTPYLSAWLPQGAGAALNDAWATFWTGAIVGWAGFVKVDGVPYVFMGTPSVPAVTFNKAVQKSSRFTSTQSIFVLSAGPVDLTVTFLSPVEPTDLVKQSIPFAYMGVSAASTDGRSHSVQVYSDISAEWVSGDDSLIVNWNSTTSGSILTHQVQLQNQTLFGEVADHTQYGSAFYSTTNTVGATFQTGADVTVRAQFVTNGKLANTLDTNFRAVSNNWPVFGLAHDLGTITAATAPVVFSVGHIRDPAIEYIVAGGGTQNRNLYFLSSFPTSASVISSFLGDFSAALTRANTFDAKVQTDAGKISADYAAVVALSIRQAFAATELTISKTSTGAFNTTDVILFMKEISSDGNVNTVDVIFPAWPIFLYTNPMLGKFLLEGLFRYQASGQYPNKWSVHDLGSSYPKALGHNDGADEAMPVEESGNMVIMALSYAQKTGDISHLQTYSALLNQWTGFLVSDSLIPANQISTDDFAGALANQTNLAIKGIVGIGAMGKIEALLGNTAQSMNYSMRIVYRSELRDPVAEFLGVDHRPAPHPRLRQLQQAIGVYRTTVSSFPCFDSIPSGAAPPVVAFAFAPTMIHNDLTRPVVLCCSLRRQIAQSESFPGVRLRRTARNSHCAHAETAWYQTHANAFGVPLDTRHTYTKTDWQMFTAAWATSTTVRNILISAVKDWVSDGQNNGAFVDQLCV